MIPFDFHCIATDLALLSFISVGKDHATDHDSAWLNMPAADGNACNLEIMAYRSMTANIQGSLRVSHTHMISLRYEVLTATATLPVFV